MTPTKHRIAAGVFLLLLLAAILGVTLEGTRLAWDLDATTTFGRGDNAPFWLALIALGGFSVVMAAGAIWQLRLSRR